MQAFLVAAPLLVAVGAAADATSLLQDKDGLLIQKALQPAYDGGNCTCMDWSFAFINHSLPCEHGLGALHGQEFCDFILSFHSNVCLQRTFMPPTLDYPICLVEESCQGSKSLGNEVARKICVPGKDKMTTEMPLAETIALAFRNGVDQGAMAGYSTAWLDRSISSMKASELEMIKASGTPTLIWSLEERTGDRLEIRGPEVYIHQFRHATNGFWNVTCLEGCTTATATSPAYPPTATGPTTPTNATSPAYPPTTTGPATPTSATSPADPPTTTGPATPTNTTSPAI